MDTLVTQSGEVVAAAAVATAAAAAGDAWRLVPLPTDHIGDDGTRWPREPFAKAFARVRLLFSSDARFDTPSGAHGLHELAYGAMNLGDLLNDADLAALAGVAATLPASARDPIGRWRQVLDVLKVAHAVAPDELVASLKAGRFEGKNPAWWVAAAATLTSLVAVDDLHGVPMWLCHDGRKVGSSPINASARKLVYVSSLPPFAERHQLFDRLHSAFESKQGEVARKWLVTNASYTVEFDGQDQLLAFAERHRENPIAVDDETLRDIRALLDSITGRSAQEIGACIGRAILLQASDGGRKSGVHLVTPNRAYLPKAIDKDNPNWPKAAAGLPGILWLQPNYEDRLRTGLGKARKTGEGVRVRGARTFLTLLGAATAPRLVQSTDLGEPTTLQRKQLLARDANQISSDWISPDMDRVLRAVSGELGRLSRKERRDRAVSLLRALSRDWERFEEGAAAPVVKAARVYVRQRGTVASHWINRLREVAWVPVGRNEFRCPEGAVLRNGSTETVYDGDDFVSGLLSNEVSEALADALGIVSRIRARDLVEMLESMRVGLVPFDANRLRLIYRQLNRIVPKTSWEPFGDMSAVDVKRTRTSDTPPLSMPGGPG